jgi:hypothetical protein
VQASLKEIFGEFVTTETTAAVTSRSEFPFIKISEALSAEINTDPIMNTSAPTPRASGSTTTLPRKLTFFKVIALLPVIASPLVEKKSLA